MRRRGTTSETALVPLREVADLVGEDEFAMRDWAEALVARARADGVELTGEVGC
jgi:hypothetical protein